MSPEEALQVAADALIDRTGNPVTDIQRMILRESLAGKGYESMTGYAPQHIKNEGKKLWDLLSEALGEKVSKTSFRGALEKRWKLGEVRPKPPLVSIYNPQTWVGRKAIIDECLPKLQGRAKEQVRVLWITGISGIGKTVLGECLASQAWDSDPSFQWIYLEILEGQNPEFTSVAADLLAKLGDRHLDPQELNNPERLATKLLQKLQSHPYWIQIDSVERLLNPKQPTEFVDVYWTTFLQRCLTESNLASRLVLTAQALPFALVEFGDRYPNTWIEIRLDGLSAVDQRLEFFAKRGVIVEGSNRDILTRIAEIYEGHPLVLKVISEDILKEFAADVFQYWQINQREFEQVARELQDARLDEAEYNEALDNKVRERIKKSLKQLPTDALNLLCCSSVFRRPVQKKFWLAMIGDRTPQQQKAAYQVLGDRALVEKEGIHQGQFLIRQHNLIRSVAYDLLKGDRSNWHAAERQAAQLWLNDYRPAPNALNLETVRGYLEAFEHYCEIEDWESAKKIAWTRLNTPTQEYLCWQLGTWGYFREQILLHSKQLDIARALGERRSEGNALGNLGNAYNRVGQYGHAIEFLLQCLTILQEIGDLRGKGAALSNLGIAHTSLGQYEQAIDFYEKALAISRAIDDRQGKGADLGNLGNAYYSLGQYERAIEFHQQHLTIAQETDDRRGEGTALGNLGNAYDRLGQYERAIDFHQQYLVISREIGDRQGEGNALGNLGIAYYGLGQYERANEFQQQHLTIAKETGDRQGEGNALANIGATQLKLEQYPECLTNNQTALEIFQEIGFREGEAEVLKNLAELHQALGEAEVARQYCQQALALATELGIPLKEECQKLMEALEKG